MKRRLRIFVPAGVRTQNSIPEYISRQSWFENAVTKFTGYEISFGFELKGLPSLFSKNFDPKSLNGLPYSIHFPNECLTKLYHSEREGGQDFINEFWQWIDTVSQWDPAPECLVFHGANIVKQKALIDKRRFYCRVEPEEWLAGARWHIKVLSQMRQAGVYPRLETVYLNNFCWIPEDNAWLPITRLSHRSGIYLDLFNIMKEAGAGCVVDFDHLLGTVQALNQECIEIKEIENLEFAQSNPEFENFFGFSAENGKVPRIIQQKASFNEMASKLNTSYYHLHGNNPWQVMVLDPRDTDTDYHRELRAILRDNAYAWKLAGHRRCGSHAPIKLTPLFQNMLQHVLKIGEGLDKPLTLTLETSNSGEILPDPFYYSRPDALEYSFYNLIQILSDFNQ